MSKNLKISTKLAIGFIIIEALLVLSLYFGYTTAEQIITVENQEHYLSSYAVFTAVEFILMMVIATGIAVSMTRGIRIAMKTNHIFYRCVSAGISILFGFQTFIILGGVIKLIPLTGITLPFVSYGGSSLLISFSAVAVLEAIANRRETV